LFEHPLDRTVLLLQRDYYPSLTRDVALEVLGDLRIALVIDDASLLSPAGRTAHATVAWALTAMGLPPRQGTADYTVALGVAPAPSRGIRISGGAWEATTEEDGPWEGEAPFGGVLAGVLAGAAALRLVLDRLATRLGQPPPELAPPGGAVLLPEFEVGHVHVGAVDVISAGAITSAAFYTLLRWRGLAGAFRVFDDDRTEVTNLNRYPLLSHDCIGRFKTDILEDFSTPERVIRGVHTRFGAAPSQCPLAPRTLVGVDHIPSRWLVQRHAPGWLHVGATSHFEVMASAHGPGGPCAGCVHPRDADDDGPIPTMSFVSLLAGALQAWSLLAHARGVPVPDWYCWPVNLGAEHGMLELTPAVNPACPLHHA
jgi:hypothetical protein